MIRLLAATILLAGCAHSQQPEDSSGFFGVATLSADGNICLQLRSEERGLPVAESYQCFKPDDPEYGDVRKHIGPITVGEAKRIAPFK